MDNFICKIANRKELLKRWEYLIDIHPSNNKWVEFKENALNHYDEKSTISYLGFLNDQIICEATAYIKDSAFIGDISEPSGLLSESMAYLAAFRTNKEHDCNYQAFTIATKSSAFRDAPPMRPPSMSGQAKSSLALEGLQLPP